MEDDPATVLQEELWEVEASSEHSGRGCMDEEPGFREGSELALPSHLSGPDFEHLMSGALNGRGCLLLILLNLASAWWVLKEELRLC
jgi:hypothetical protein